MALATDPRRPARLSRLIVTRPAPEAQIWANALCQCAWPAHALPLIEIGEPSDAATLNALRHWRQQVFQVDAAMFVSGAAVTHFFTGMAPNRVTAVLAAGQASARFWAPGPATAAAAQTSGTDSRPTGAPARRLGPASAGARDPPEGGEDNSAQGGGASAAYCAQAHEPSFKAPGSVLL